MISISEKYDWNEHKHRYAVWAAATASSTSPKCRFSVLNAALGIELLGEKWHEKINGLASSRSQDEFDEKHKNLCGLVKKSFESVKDDSIKSNVKRAFTFGVAAKFVNIYLKTVFDETQAQYIHPPLDRILLTSLVSPKCNHSDRFKQACKDVRDHLQKQENGKRDGLSWSRFDYLAYRIWIDAIKECSSPEIWKVEEFWHPSGSR